MVVGVSAPFGMGGEPGVVMAARCGVGRWVVVVVVVGLTSRKEVAECGVGLAFKALVVVAACGLWPVWLGNAGNDSGIGWRRSDKRE